MDYDQYVALRRDRIRARNAQKGGGNVFKLVGSALALVVGFVALVALFALVTAGPLMLVLGALHSSNGLSAVPALGFWQTLGSLFVIGAIGRAFHPSATTTSSKS